ncbi:MAG: hypothetical protein LBN40_02350 [Oscillospiraceae bacterium]|jgi:cell division protein FtsB|nr:hypothetical protein [Oscillospiraceae bacterium]
MFKKHTFTKKEKNIGLGVLLFLFFLWQAVLVVDTIQVREQAEELQLQREQAQLQLSEALAYNAGLQNYADDERIDSYKELLARDKLGYVLPNETVYYIISD